MSLLPIPGSAQSPIAWPDQRLFPCGPAGHSAGRARNAGRIAEQWFESKMLPSVSRPALEAQASVPSSRKHTSGRGRQQEVSHSQDAHVQSRPGCRPHGDWRRQILPGPRHVETQRRLPAPRLRDRLPGGRHPPCESCDTPLAPRIEAVSGVTLHSLAEDTSVEPEEAAKSLGEKSREW
jgi:hypothetical protein